MRKLILILGARGMLGQALVKEINGFDYEMAGWDKAELDITDRYQTLKKIVALKPKIIINAAAYNSVDRAETEDSELAFKINAEAVKYLIEASAQTGALFVHYSTDYVFRGDCEDGYAENAAPDPQSVYAKSKWEGERRVMEMLAKRHPAASTLGAEGSIFYLIRTSRLFGSAGADKNAKRSFVETMLDLVKNNGKVELDLIDTEESSPTYVADLARATRELIESGAPAGIYHRTNAGACTWYEWARKIFELAGLSVKLNSVPASHFPRPAPRPKFSRLLTVKLPPLRPWEESLKEFLSNF